MNTPDTVSSTPQDSDTLAARRAALDILTEVTEKHQPLDIVLDQSASLKALDTRDRAFTRMLVSTTLRRLGQLDDLIEKAQDRPGSIKIQRLQNILRLGAAQLFFMDVPDHAALDTSVRLTGENQMEKQKAFVNALLRTLTREGKNWLEKQDAPRLNTPPWLLELWIKDYGLRTAAEIAAANQSEAPLDITLKDQNQTAQWLETLQAEQLPTGSLRLKNNTGHVANLPGFADGAWWVQDAAAALPAKLFGNIKGQEIIDMCAAPGGKTMQLAALGANVIALDRSPKRLQKLKENLTRTGLENNVTVEVADAAAWTPKTAPQNILLDAPCTATGTIRRHPDMPWLKTPRDLEQLSGTQTRLLAHAAEILNPGGTLIYCTCSLQKAEGEAQIENLLKQNPAIARNPVTPAEIGGHKEMLDENGDVRLLPGHLKSHGGIDGFFIARLQKTR
ncbi:MAG: 16S rRNA (cytosine(967)-C(5))-methyltransferase RsmB [Alphaproteobacteria bacterium]|nr:16S rRNA (cytosine(967)-C(5))-methyltransferase RsmB [Alphaproteobacteria bacterium]